MVKAIVASALFSFLSQVCYAQYFQFSQNNFTEMRISPAAVAATDYATMNAVFRNQKTGGDFNLNSSFISAAYPFINHKRKRWGGLGVSLMDDRSGGMFNIQEASLSYAANIYLNKTQTLALGARGMFRQHKVDATGLTTGSQYIPDRGFDEGIFNGEAFNELQQTFFTLSFGAQWQQVDRHGKRTGYASLSVYDFNRPKDSFFGTSSTLRETVVGAVGFRAYEGRDVSVFPEVIYSGGYGEHSVNVGAVTRFEIQPSGNAPGGQLDVLSKVVIGRGAIAGLQLHRDNFSVGFTYDFPLIERNPANLGAVEVGLQLRRLVKPAALKIKRKGERISAKKRKPRKNGPESSEIKQARPTVKRTKEVEGDSIAVNKVVVPPDPASVGDSVSTQTSVGKIAHEPLAFEKTTLRFNFALNSTSLDANTRSYLNDLAGAMKENQHLQLKLTGHTDNTGSAAYNEKLSVERAKAVKDYLILREIAAERIIVDGKGLREPLNDNSTPEKRSLNRRVEMVLEFRP